MKFRSELSSQIQSTNEVILDFRDLKKAVQVSTLTVLLLTGLIVGILFILAFYQIVLQTDANIRDNIVQIGILRSIGLKKNDVSQIVMTEALVNVASAILCGFLLAYAEVYVCLASMDNLFEQPFDYQIEWSILLTLLIIGYLITYIGTKVAVTRINNKTVANIVKMK